MRCCGESNTLGILEQDVSWMLKIKGWKVESKKVFYTSLCLVNIIITKGNPVFLFVMSSF